MLMAYSPSQHEQTLKVPPLAFTCPAGVAPAWANWPSDLAPGAQTNASVAFWAAMAADVGVPVAGTRSVVVAQLKVARDAAVALAAPPQSRAGRTLQLFPSCAWDLVVQVVLGDAPALSEALQAPAVEAELAKLAPATVVQCAGQRRCAFMVQEALMQAATRQYPYLNRMLGDSVMARLPEVVGELEASAEELEAWSATLPPAVVQSVADKAAAQRVLALNAVLVHAKRRKAAHPTALLEAALLKFQVPEVAAALVLDGINDATAPLLPDPEAAVRAAGVADSFLANNAAAALRSMRAPPGAAGSAAKAPKAVALSGAATRHHVMAASLQAVLMPAANQARLEHLVQLSNLPSGKVSDDDLLSGKFLCDACPELPANALLRPALLSAYRAPVFTGGDGALQAAISVAHMLDEALAAHLLVQVCDTFMVGDDLTEHQDPTGFWLLRCGDLSGFLTSVGFATVCQLAKVSLPLDFGDHDALRVVTALSKTVAKFFGQPVAQGLNRMAAKAARLAAAARAAASADNSAVFFARWSAALSSQCTDLRRGTPSLGVVCSLALPESAQEAADFALLLERARSAAQARAGAASPAQAGAARPGQRWKAIAGAPPNGAAFKTVKAIDESLGPRVCVYDLFGVVGCTSATCRKCK